MKGDGGEEDILRELVGEYAGCPACGEMAEVSSELEVNSTEWTVSLGLDCPCGNDAVVSFELLDPDITWGFTQPPPPNQVEEKSNEQSSNE